MSTRSPKTCLWGPSTAAVLGTGIPSLLWSSAPSGLDSIARTYLQYWSSDCRLGQQRTLLRRRNTGAGPDPKCPQKTTQEALCSRKLVPPPPQTNIWLPLISRHPQIESVTPFAGSICGQGAREPRTHCQVSAPLLLAEPCRLQCRREFDSCCFPPAVPLSVFIIDTVRMWPLDFT